MSSQLDKPVYREVGSRKKIDLAKYVRRSALESDYSELIDYNFVLTIDDKPIIVYLNLKNIPNYSQIVNTLQHTNIPPERRTTGLRTRHKVIGYCPRDTIRNDYCRAAAFSRDDPEGHAIICDFGKTLSDYYRKYCPEMFEYHYNVTKQGVLDNWRIDRTPFTSGIINKNSQLKYHLDRGNLRNVYSNMIVFKKDCDGGHLAIPEFDIGLKCANKSVVFFNGQDILHGVTPLKLKSLNAYRFSIVYYTLQRMWKCEPLSDELARIQKRKTNREILRYKRLTGELKPEDDIVLRDLDKQAERYRIAAAAKGKPPVKAKV